MDQQSKLLLLRTLNKVQFIQLEMIESTLTFI